MAHRSQSSSVGDNPMDPNYLPPHYREEYRLAIDALVEDDDLQVGTGMADKKTSSLQIIVCSIQYTVLLYVGMGIPKTIHTEKCMST